MIKIQTFLLLFFFTAFSTTGVYSQAKKFPSPPSADAIKNPLKDDGTSTTAGKLIYVKYCVTCHGDKGKGDGIAAPGLPKRPADHTSSFVQSQTDGALYWIISAGNNPMPTYKKTLTPTQRWQVVNYIRTLANTSKK